MRRGFGDIARDARVAAEKTLKEVADALGYTVAYLSDIERGNRNPPTADIARKWASLLGADPDRFEWYAQLDRRSIEFPVNRDDLDAVSNRVALTLARKWRDLSDERLEEILEIAERDGGE
jgi:transcriptional regulator with XRE-family HTH domain